MGSSVQCGTNQNGSCLQKCGQVSLKIGYLINFSRVRLQIYLHSCHIHRNKARAGVTPPLPQALQVQELLWPTCCCLCSYRAEVRWPRAETRAGTPGGPQGFVTSTFNTPQAHSHTSSLYIAISSISKQAPRSLCSCFPCFSCSRRDPGMFSPPLQSEASNPLGISSPPKPPIQGLVRCSMSCS